MTILEHVARFLERKGFGTIGQNIFLVRVPSSLTTTEEVFWLTGSGGSQVHMNTTGERQLAYSVTVNFRSRSARQVDSKLSALTDIFNCSNCVSLPGLEIISMRTTNFNMRQDLDAEERMYGYIQIQIVVQKTCN